MPYYNNEISQIMINALLKVFNKNIFKFLLRIQIQKLMFITLY